MDVELQTRRLNASANARTENFAIWTTLKNNQISDILIIAMALNGSICTWSSGIPLRQFQNAKRFPWTWKFPLGTGQVKVAEETVGEAVVVFHPSANRMKE
jgi:hypothetical protein